MRESKRASQERGQEERPRQYKAPPGPRKCLFCSEGVKIDYKQADFLRRFITDRGRIKARRKTGTCARHQRQLAVAIKRARHFALLPFTAEQIRGS